MSRGSGRRGRIPLPARMPILNPKSLEKFRRIPCNQRPRSSLFLAGQTGPPPLSRRRSRESFGGRPGQLASELRRYRARAASEREGQRPAARVGLGPVGDLGHHPVSAGAQLAALDGDRVGRAAGWAGCACRRTDRRYRTTRGRYGCPAPSRVWDRLEMQPVGPLRRATPGSSGSTPSAGWLSTVSAGPTPRRGCRWCRCRSRCRCCGSGSARAPCPRCSRSSSDRPG